MLALPELVFDGVSSFPARQSCTGLRHLSDRRTGEALSRGEHPGLGLRGGGDRASVRSRGGGNRVEELNIWGFHTDRAASHFFDASVKILT